MNKLFDYKRKYIASDGEEYVNMGIPAFDANRVGIKSMAKLNQDNNGRIDTFTYYNIMEDLENIDTVMYVNHIFNPFAIQEGDVVYVPNGDDYYYKEAEPELVDGSKLSTKMTNDKPMTYAETVEYLGKLGLGIK